MNNLMRRAGIVAVLCVLLCLCLLVCSCNKKGGNDETTPAETNPVETPADTPAESDPPETDPVPEKVTYTVTVKNAAGEGIANVSVQLCEGTSCHPGTTDASGVATFELTEAVYQANINAAVAGYVVDTAAKYDFAEGETSLVITLEAEAPVVDDSVVDLKDEEYQGIDEDDLLYTYECVVGDINDMVEEPVAEVVAGDSVKYIYEATANGSLTVEVVEGLGVKVNVKNVTTGVSYLPLSGKGELEIPVVAGGTYEITVEYTKSEEVAYEVAAKVEADGSKEAPIILLQGMVATEIVIPEGETVWCLFADSYLFIDDAAVKVTVDGTTYAPDENGNIELGLAEAYRLIGLSSSVANDKVVVYLSGSKEYAPIYFYAGAQSVDVSEEAAALVDTVYCAFVSPCQVYSLNVTMNGQTVCATHSESKFYYFSVEAGKGTLSVSYVDLNPLGSQTNPIEIAGESVIVSPDTIAANTQPNRFAMMPGAPEYVCSIYYTYKASEDCTVTFNVGEADGTVSFQNVNGTDTPNYEETTVTLKKGDVLLLWIDVNEELRASGNAFNFDLTVTATENNSGNDAGNDGGAQ